MTVTCLLPAGASPHTFEPTADQVKRSSRADLLFHIGGGLDDWTVKAAAAGSDRLIILGLAEAALQRGWSPPQELSSGLQTGEPFNPHLWLDPLTVRDYLCPAIAEAMVEADPQNETFYRANLTAYQRELTALDEEIRASPVSYTHLDVYKRQHYGCSGVLTDGFACSGRQIGIFLDNS